MKQLRTLADLASESRRKPIVAAAGFFDGVHLGHQKIIRAAIQRAGELNGEAWALTFDTHPLRILNPPAAPPLLTSTRHKRLLLERLGLHGCLLLPFNRDVAATPPETFVRDLLACSPPLVELMVGRNWRFGAQARGDPAMLSRQARGHKLTVNVAEAKRWKGETISSTRIRAAVLSGRLEQAATMLGRPFSVLGTVVPGEQIGRGLGFPTANLDTHNESLPPFGVYAAAALVLDPASRRRPEPLLKSVLNFGTRPTFRHARQEHPVIEVHFLEARRDVYGCDIEVFFIEKLRSEKRFPSPEALHAQITADANRARRTLTPRRVKKLKESLYIEFPIPI